MGLKASRIGSGHGLGGVARSFGDCVRTPSRAQLTTRKRRNYSPKEQPNPVAGLVGEYGTHGAAAWIPGSRVPGSVGRSPFTPQTEQEGGTPAPDSGLMLYAFAIPKVPVDPASPPPPARSSAAVAPPPTADANASAEVPKKRPSVPPIPSLGQQRWQTGGAGQRSSSA